MTDLATRLRKSAYLRALRELRADGALEYDLVDQDRGVYAARWVQPAWLREVGE
jgi:hypothetical protein